MSDLRNWRGALAVTTLFGLIVFIGCDSGKSGPAADGPKSGPPPSAAPATASRPTSPSTDSGASARPPTASPPAAAPTDDPTARPATSAPAAASGHDKPAHQPKAASASKPDSGERGIAKLQGLVEVLELMNPGEAYQTIEEVGPPTKFSLVTRNVKRMRIARDRLPTLRRDRSISLLVDNQGIEWLRQTPVIELQRTSTGAWEIVK